MKKRNFLTLTLFFAVVTSWSQYVIRSVEELNNLKQVPQEKVFVNHTGPVVFAGEYMYYSFQCFNAQNSRPSAVSKVGYIALVNEEREYVLEQKIKLVKGLGQGDFFVSTDIASGNYKLLGYTQWMKNNGLAQVFKDDVVIVNPYTVDQSALLADAAAEEKEMVAQTAQVMDSSTVGLLLNGTVYGKREKVNFSLKNYKGNLGNGTYTIKIRKKSVINPVNKMNAITYAKDYLNVDKQIKLKVGDSLFLPEQRGELLFGTVTDALSNQPLSNTPVVVSLPGKEFVLKFATTDDNGTFYTYLRKDYKERVAIVQVEDSDRDVDIVIKAPRKLDVSELEFGTFTFNEKLASAIKKRSVHNQIENQFFSLKPDSILLGDPIDPFDGGIPEVFVLDDYTRFPTFQETLVEILNNAGYRNNAEGNDYIRIAQDFETFNEEFNSFPAIVLFDGVYITNHEAMKEFDARTIKSISLIRDQFQLANKEYQGILSVETFDGDYFENYNQINGTINSIIKPTPIKNYYVQTYGSNDFNRIPDYRTLLFWKPNVVVEEGSNLDFEFFTSDISGEYEVIVDGFTTFGKPISFTRSIFVE
ncbi:MAG: hypothetical protein ED555_10815 [Allomuricauda sp.]|nr:MAG: hypothetical protein ED555_10815 [Allomuricauda sp.]